MCQFGFAWVTPFGLRCVPVRKDKAAGGHSGGKDCDEGPLTVGQFDGLQVFLLAPLFLD